MYSFAGRKLGVRGERWKRELCVVGVGGRGSRSVVCGADFCYNLPKKMSDFAACGSSTENDDGLARRQRERNTPTMRWTIPLVSSSIGSSRSSGGPNSTHELCEALLQQQTHTHTSALCAIHAQHADSMESNTNPKSIGPSQLPLSVSYSNTLQIQHLN